MAEHLADPVSGEEDARPPVDDDDGVGHRGEEAAEPQLAALEFLRPANQAPLQLGILLVPADHEVGQWAIERVARRWQEPDRCRTPHREWR